MRLIALLALTALPCLAQAAEPAAAAPTQSVAPEHRGAPFTTTVKDTTTLESIAAQADQMNGKVVRVDVTVSSVCKKKGCWMGIKSEKGTVARVTFKDYAFFMPLDCEGRKATLEGVVETKRLDPKERAHLAEDAGKKVDEIPEVELRVVATGVELAGR